MDDLLRVEDLRVDFASQGGDIRAVDGVSFRVRPGSTVALVGESGSGKSVTAQAILGLLPSNASITGGRILFRDSGRRTGNVAEERRHDVVDLAGINPNTRAFRAIRGCRVSMIFQEPMSSLSPLHTVGDQVSECLFLHRPTDRKTGREITEDMLRMVGFPDPRRAFDTYPFELSGGLRQRAMIAMALICHPALLIADEPSTALDVTIQAQILKLIQELQAEIGMAVLIITHDLGVVANVAEEVIVIYNGRLMESGTLEDIFERPAHPYLKALLHAVPRLEMARDERLVPIREIKLETGRLLKVGRERVEGREEAPLIEIRGVSRRFTTRKETRLLPIGPEAPITAVDNVSLEIKRGECLGLVGESGCGKTTLSKIMMRAIDASSGTVVYHDNGQATNLLSLSERELFPLRRKFQYIFQDPFGSLNPRMTVFDIVSEPLIIHNVGDSAYRREMVTELMRLVGLDPRYLSRYPHSFSGGQRQRIGIARALALMPELLICDEPVSALDVSVQAQVLNLLKDLQTTLGLTYLFISHNMAVVNYMADRIAVMCAGNLVELAPSEALFRNPIHPYTRALVAAVPTPDLGRTLDFSSLMEGRASDPSAWPPPFDAAPGDSGRALQMIDLGDGHFVFARAAPPMAEAAK